MVRRVRIEEYFRKRLRLERDEVRGWSQAELAKMLTARGIDMHPTTIAKIEAGDRAARIEEVAVIADLFGLSADTMLGRKGGLESEGSHAMTLLAETARRLSAELDEIRDRWGLAFRDLECQFEDLHSFEQYVYGDAPWNVQDMPDEYRRAVLMRLCRDEAMGQLNQAIAVVLSVTEYRAMTAAELPGALRAAEATIADMKRQKQEQEQ